MMIHLTLKIKSASFSQWLMHPNDFYLLFICEGIGRGEKGIFLERASAEEEHDGALRSWIKQSSCLWQSVGMRAAERRRSTLHWFSFAELPCADGGMLGNKERVVVEEREGVDRPTRGREIKAKAFPICYWSLVDYSEGLRCNFSF